MTTANLTFHSKELSIWMLLLDEFCSHSWFNWPKLANKSLNTLVFPFCHQPQQGQSCPTMDLSLAEAAGSMVWQGTRGPEWPCGPKREGHGHGAHPSLPGFPLCCWRLHRQMDTEVWWAILSDPSQSCGSQPWGCAPQRDTWGVPIAQPQHSAVEHLTMLLLRSKPASSRDAKLAKDPFHYEGHTLCSSALVPAKPCNCVCSLIHEVPVLPSPWQPLIQYSIKMQWTCVLLGLLPIQLSFCVLWSLSQ